MIKRKIITVLFLGLATGAAQAQDSNVLVGLNAPAYGVKIKTNFPAYNGNYARAFMLSNQDASVDFFGLGALGNVVNGVSGFTYGYIGQGFNNPMMTFLANGNIGIGTTDPKGYKLAVAGNMIAESVKVQLKGSWADYVFEDDYKLKTLEEMEAFVKKNKHLPEIPSAAEVKNNGIDLGEMNVRLLQKIEELTLHLIEKEKKDNDQQKQIDLLKLQIDDLLKSNKKSK